MGIIAYIFRHPLGDCTNGGPTATAKGVTIVNAEGPFEPSDDYPAAVMVRHRTLKALHIVMASQQGRQTMAGGNFAYTSDSRFGELARSLLGDPDLCFGPVSVHDRVE